MQIEVGRGRRWSGLGGWIHHRNRPVMGASCNFGTLTLDGVFDDCFASLGVPVYRGASFGHNRRKLTLPVGLPVEIDADACTGTLCFLQPSVL